MILLRDSICQLRGQCCVQPNPRNISLLLADKSEDDSCGLPRLVTTQVPSLAGKLAGSFGRNMNPSNFTSLRSSMSMVKDQETPIVGQGPRTPTVACEPFYGLNVTTRSLHAPLEYRSEFLGVTGIPLDPSHITDPPDYWSDLPYGSLKNLLRLVQCIACGRDLY